VRRWRGNGGVRGEGVEVGNIGFVGEAKSIEALDDAGVVPKVLCEVLEALRGERGELHVVLGLSELLHGVDDGIARLAPRLQGLARRDLTRAYFLTKAFHWIVVI